ncbi:hypothetical protein Pint_18788 [Pistacia integerrima]|uniref:Uncharacterized protein n=1 Tax=Pistacia integerrima TaxID=434235 RepID=A0ACC0YY81_9ROSI|nr:hypothetical protein Pint_18788 [Pistacia integerrima]
MGRTLDALLRRSFKTSKFKTIVKLAVSRDAIMKNQRQARYSHAKSDVIELLNLGHHERALLRAEYVIKEENMLDVLVMIENYCHLMIERVTLFQKSKLVIPECPEELREAVSSLIFASSRCGEFPELMKIREMLTLRFGKEFAARAVELRNNCEVNPKIVQKLSARRPSLESRLKVLKEISAEIGVTLHLEEDVPATVKEQKQQEPNESATFDDAKLGVDTQNLSEDLELDEKLSESVQTRKKYRDVATAARDAFESAAFAAVAARAAIELSRSESQDYDSDDDGGGSSHPQGNGSESPNLQSDKYAVTEADEGSSDRLDFDKIQPMDNPVSESEGEDMAENSDKIHLRELEENERNAGRGYIMRKQYPDSESENDEENEVASDEDDNDNVNNEDNLLSQKLDDLDSNRKPSLPMMAYEHVRENNEDDHQCLSVEEIDDNLSHQSPKLDSLKTQDDPTIKAMQRRNRMTNEQSLNIRKQLHEQHSSTDWTQFSVRTIRAQKI